MIFGKRSTGWIRRRGGCGLWRPRRSPSALQPLEAGHAVTGHRKFDHVPAHRLHRQVGRQLEGRLEQVAVKTMCRFSSVAIRASVRSRTGRRTGGRVAVRDAGGQLLESDVGHRVRHQVQVVRLETLAHAGPCGTAPAGSTRRAGSRACDAVPALLRVQRAAQVPQAPSGRRAESRGGSVEVVLRREVHHQGDPADLGDLGLALLQASPSSKPGKLRPYAPGHVLVRHPVLGDLQVPVEFGLDHFLQRVQQPGVKSIRRNCRGAGAVVTETPGDVRPGRRPAGDCRRPAGKWARKP